MRPPCMQGSADGVPDCDTCALRAGYYIGEEGQRVEPAHVYAEGAPGVGISYNCSHKMCGELSQLSYWRSCTCVRRTVCVPRGA